MSKLPALVRMEHVIWPNECLEEDFRLRLQQAVFERWFGQDWPLHLIRPHGLHAKKSKRSSHTPHVFIQMIENEKHSNEALFWGWLLGQQHMTETSLARLHGWLPPFPDSELNQVGENSHCSHTWLDTVSMHNMAQSKKKEAHFLERFYRKSRKLLRSPHLFFRDSSQTRLNAFLYRICTKE